MRVRSGIVVPTIAGGVALSGLIALVSSSGLAHAEGKASLPADEGETMQIQAVIRDFKAYNEAEGHDDFQRYAGSTRVGLVADKLGADGKPVLKSRMGSKIITEYKDSGGRNINPALYDAALGDVEGSLQPQTSARIYSDTSFESWYRDVPGVNLSTVITLTLEREPGSDVFVFDSATHPDYRASGGFFPVNNQLFGNYGSTGKNFHFTTEIHTEFLYKRNAGYLFKFTGDDDVWVFIDGRLVIDLGSLHSIREQYLDLDRLDWLEDGEVYTLAVFHAERRTSQSNFRMETTLPLRPAEVPSVTAAFD